MKPKSPEERKDFAEDLKTFEKLPTKTKKLAILKDQAEKATGPESAKLNEKIRVESKTGLSGHAEPDDSKGAGARRDF